MESNRRAQWLVFAAVSLLALYSPSCEASGLCRYLFSKVLHALSHPEIHTPALEINRIAFLQSMARVKPERRRVLIRLSDLHPNHLLTTEASVDKMQGRAERVRENAGRMLASDIVPRADQDTLIPSPVPLSVVRDKFGNFIIVDGVGRYFSLRQGLGEGANPWIEVDFLDHRGDRSVTSILDRLLRLSGTLIPPPTTVPNYRDH